MADAPQQYLLRAPQDHRLNLCGWGRASAMQNKSALHMGCKYSLYAWVENKASKEDHCFTQAQHATQDRMRFLMHRLCMTREKSGLGVAPCSHFKRLVIFFNLKRSEDVWGPL